jgi:hypothetical protein
MRPARAQFGVAQRTQQREHPGAYPHQQQCQARFGALRGNARIEKDAAADDAADHHQRRVPQAKTALIAGSR